MTRTTEIAASVAYVRQSANPADSHPYQVRRNLPDQTYVVVGRYVSAAAAYAAADAANRDAAADRAGVPDPDPSPAAFDVWIDGERTGGTIEARSLADAVGILVAARGEARGFDPLGRFDVTPAGGAWIDRALCSCEVEDDGDVESGPSLSIVEPNPECDLHGRVASPDAWRRRCPGLPGHPAGPCPNDADPGDRYCAGCRAEFDATADEVIDDALDPEDYR